MLQPRICMLETKAPYFLILTYETGEVKRFDVLPYMSGEWHGELKNPEYFEMVHVLPSGTGIVWPNGQDIAPHELYENSLIIDSRLFEHNQNC